MRYLYVWMEKFMVRVTLPWTRKSYKNVTGEVEWNPSGLEWYNLAGHCDSAKAVVSVRGD
jgi:hypothetical protein